MTAVFIEIDAGEATITCAYDPDVVDTIKRLPAPHRSWDRDRRVWLIREGYVSALASWLRADGHDVTVGAGEADPLPENWGDALFEAVGDGLIEPVYRALSRILHPDIGGDTQLMQELNAARDRHERRGAA